MRYGTVCSGIGVPEIAAGELGWENAFASEIDAFPRAVLGHHYPEHNLHGDFTTITEKDYGSVDVLIGGTPCQSFSVAGKRAGLDDPRGNLALEYLALARRLNSRWIVWENVPGMLSSWSDDSEQEGQERSDFAEFLSFVGECGYQCAWRVLDGQYFGVPQRRRRIILVGYIGDWRPPAAVLFEREGLRGDITPSREAGKAIAGTVGARTGRSCGAQDAMSGHLVDTLTSNGDAHSGFRDENGLVIQQGPADIAPTLDTHYGDKMGLEDQHIRGGQDCSYPQTALCLNAGGMGRQDAESETLIPTGGCFDVGVATLGHTKSNGLGVGMSGTTGTLEAVSSANQAVIGRDIGVRRLTPTECERLMGVPDGYTAVMYNGKMAKDGPRYKALGNSMIVGKMRWVLGRIDKVQKILDGVA